MKEYKSQIKEFYLSKRQVEFPKVKINNSSDAQKYARLFYADDIEIYESCFIILLNNQKDTIGYAKISQGGITGSVVDVRIVCKYAIESLATSAIFVHNHPSGNAGPSSEDMKVTEQLRDALKLLDVRLVDSIILTTDKYFSFADEGYVCR